MVICPLSTVSTHTRSSVRAKSSTAGVSSIRAREVSPRVQAKIEAIELVEVALSYWCWR